MQTIAFYAPLKPPTHPVPSGDREIARNLITAIQSGTDRMRVALASDLRLFDGSGDVACQTNLLAQANTEVTRLVEHWSDGGLALWVTYHNYYKAPDLIGPAVCGALGTPYVQIESTRARSRLSGPWALFAAAAEAASDAADLIFYFTSLDRITLERDKVPGQRLVRLDPFLPVTDPPPAASVGEPARPMLSAGMMRPGDKLASYRIIADTLAHLKVPDWQLDIAGDGPARADVEALMAPFGDRVRFLGQLDRDALATAYDRAALFLWPGVNEAFGMVYLEAQAAGLPVVAQNRPGVCDVLGPGSYPPPEAGAAALADELAHLLTDPHLRTQRGFDARARMAQSHLMPAATATFWDAARPLLEEPT